MRKPGLKRRWLSLVLAVCMVADTFGFALPVYAAGPPQLTVTLYSGDAMPNGEPESSSAMLFTTYLSEARNPNDEITLAMNAQQPFQVADSAVQLGTESEPFSGIVRFNAISDSNFTATKALFAYLSTDAQFLTNSDAPFTGTISFTRLPSLVQANQNSALFADHVVCGSDPGPVSLNICCLNDGEHDVTYAGVLGDMDDDVLFELIYTNNASSGGSVSNVFSQGNVGLICGSMGEDSRLTVTLSGSYTDYSVVSDSGAAGGLVGVMKPGSQLILAASYSDAPTVTANGSAYTEPDYGSSHGGLAPGAVTPVVLVPDSLDTNGAGTPAQPAEETPGKAADAPAQPAAETPTGGTDTPEQPADEAPGETADAPAQPADEEPGAEPIVPDAPADEAPGETADAPAQPTDEEPGAEPIVPDAPADEAPSETADAPAQPADEEPGAEPIVPDAPVSAHRNFASPADESPAAEADEPASAEEEAPSDPVPSDENESEPAVIRLQAPAAPALRSAGAGTSPRIDTSTLKSGFAGGLVGWMEDAEIVLDPSVTVTVAGAVAGLNGAGGVIGRCILTQDRTFALDDYTITASLGDASFTNACVGGMFGRLDADADVTVTDAAYLPAPATRDVFNLRPSFVHGKDGGGVIGFYRAGSLAQTLLIRDVKPYVVASGSVSMSGGIIGRISDSPAAYVEMRNVGVRAGAKLRGGLMGSMGNGGSFLNVCEYAGLRGSADGGLVCYMNHGVLRLQGVTHMHDADRFNGGLTTANGGQLVYQRGGGLVYAVGTGSDSTIDNVNGTGWAFHRVDGSRRDDIADWGEVLRLGGSPLSMSDGILTEDFTAHTVTVAAAVTDISSEVDFAKTALNMQLNTGSVPAGGSLRFAGAQNSSALLVSDLTLSDDVDLHGTGLIGLTRDDGVNAAFTGSLDGGGNTVTLAAGEVYGLDRSGSAIAEGGLDRGAGRIYQHQYVGLFAKTGSGVTVEDLTVDGTVSVQLPDKKSGTWNVGGLAAYHSGTLTLDDCSFSETITYTPSNDQPYAYIGGAIGQVSDTAGTVTVQNCRFETDFVDKKDAGNSRVYSGGVIGYVNSSGASNQIDFAFSDITLAGSFTNAAASSTNYVHHGGLIGYICPNSSNAVKRTVSLQNVTVADLNVTVRSNEGAGGLLGYQWLGVDVTIGTAGQSDGLVIGVSGNSAASPTLSFTPTGTNAMMGGLTMGATGHWTLNDVRTGMLTLNTGGADVDFGFVAASGVVNGPHSKPAALYLEVVGAIPAHYDLSGVQVTGSGFDLFDEVVTYTVPLTISGNNNSISVTPKPITDNGAAIVSLRTLDGAPVVMDGSACNTYQSQTAYAKANQAKAEHERARYYYNLDTIRAKASPSDGEKLLLWSLNQYAHSTIKTYFPNPLGSTLTGNFDMAGLSYYPVTASGVKINSATVKFYNEGFESSELVAGGDSYARSSRAATQHKLLHSGILYDATDLTVNTLTLQGTVGAMSDGSGFLVRGTLRDSVGHTSGVRTVVLDNALVRVGAATPAGVVGNIYAPLLINKLGSSATDQPTDLTVASVSTTGYAADAAAASSLIGDANGKNIQLFFSDMRLDARTAALADGAVNSALTAAYATNRSIFTRATLLNSFRYDDLNSDGRYNYNLTEDWSGASPLHHVTYGREINGSTEFGSTVQTQYYDQAVYTSPASSSAASAYDFTGGRWLPHVYTAYNAAQHYHELKVNQKLLDLTSGCGKWDDPYLITDGKQLVSVAQIIRGDPVDSAFQLVLPFDLAPNVSHDASATAPIGKDYVYTCSDGSAFTTASDSKTASVASVREYLAGAYYKLSNSVTIPDGSFYGLGSVNGVPSNFESAYAFRGVIDGNRKSITNASSSPLIANSNGAVVKDLTLTVTKPYSFTQNNASKNNTLSFEYYGGMECYGGLIGKVMGGDTFIDGVSVEYALSGTISGTGTAARLVPIGGFIGVLMNGTVVFRNTNEVTGFDAACPYADNDGYLYVNPFIGRVIAGCSFSEDGTVDNGTKNYEIPELDPSESDMLSVAGATVTAPNGQALWVLGALVNSGAASASAAGGSYGVSGIWSAYRNYTSARTGDSAADGGASGVTGYHDSVYAGSTKTPYLVTAYATDANARCAGAKSSVTLNVTGDCTIPAGFRGIGCIYQDNNSLRLSVATVDGKSHSVELDMRYLEYVDSNANQFENYRAAANSAGFGLFNTIGKGNKGDAAAIFKDLSLTGSVFYEVKSTAGVTTYDWNNYETGQGNNLTSLSTGGLVGYLYDKNFSFQNIQLDGLEVEGARYAGGLAGRVTTDAAGYRGVITQCGTGEDGDPITVRGGFSAGGLIGRLFAIKRNTYTLTITGDASAAANSTDPFSIVSGGKSVVKLNEIASLGTKGDNETYHNFAFSAGGLVGFIQTSNSSNSLTFSDYEVRGGSVSCDYEYGNNRPDNGRAGGVFGTLAHSNAVVSGIRVLDVDVTGYYAGGFAGKSQIGWVTESRSFSDITVDGSPLSGSGDNARIKGDASTGGLFGLFELHDNALAAAAAISDCSVSNYDITSTKRALTGRNSSNTFTGTNGAGGVIGDLFLYKAAVVVDIADTTVENCAISYSSLSSERSSTSSQRGAGGLVGVVYTDSASATRYLAGHDLLVVNNTVENLEYASASAAASTSRSDNCGTVIGWVHTMPVKLVGVTAYGTEMTADSSADPVGHTNVSGNPFGTDGYAVFADYNGVSAAVGRNTGDGMLFGGADLAATEPWVTVNPALTVDTADHILTSDGLASDVASAAISGIISDADLRYGIAWNKTGIQTSLIPYMSTFKTEAAITDASPDVAVLVIDAAASAADVTARLNSYLDLLTNTVFDYSVPAQISGICELTIHRMALQNDGSFSLTDTDVSLAWDQTNRRFAPAKSLVDNDRASFTLIDVAYADPADPTAVAYHLYAPVLVKKVLEFEFTSLVLPGTTYRAADYVGRKQLLENFGTPATLCFTYEYQRSASEWLSSLSIGDKLLDGFAKSITLTKYGSADALPAGTELVLVDAQTKTPYYLTLGANFTGTLPLASFIAGDGVTHFSPVSIADQLEMAAEVDAENGVFVRCSADDVNAQILIDGSCYRLATDDDSSETHYSLSCGSASAADTYYLSIFTDADASGIARYAVDCPDRLPDGYPTICTSDAAQRRSDLILGRVYTITSTLTTAGGDSDHVMDRMNYTISADMSATVTLNDGSIYSAYVGSVYHTFLLHLTRSDEDGSRTAILGEPTVSGTYSVDGAASAAYMDGGSTSWTGEGGYAQFTEAQDLSGSLTDPSGGYTATITASVLLNYNANEASIEAQFPYRPSDPTAAPGVGTTAFLKSNIASTPERTAFSSTSLRADDSTGNRYFCTSKQKEAILHYNVKSSAIVGDLSDLGVNPLDKDIETSAAISTVGVLNFREVAQQSEDYTHLRVVLTLGQKNDNYVGALNFSEYFDSMTVAGASVSLSGSRIELYLPRNRAGYPLLDFSSDGYEATIPIDFTVKTGAVFESAGKVYSNYRVTLDVDLVDGASASAETLVNAASKYVVYTNARVLPDFIL